MCMKHFPSRIEGNSSNVMKLALLKIFNNQKAINKQFPKVVRKGSMRIQCPFEGIEPWLRHNDLPQLPELYNVQSLLCGMQRPLRHTARLGLDWSWG